MTAEQIAEMIAALRTQRQIDADGCMVGVSRQACEEATDLILTQAAEIAWLKSCNDQLEQDLSDMRDNADSAYRRGYWAGGNGA